MASDSSWPKLLADPMRLYCRLGGGSHRPHQARHRPKEVALRMRDRPTHLPLRMRIPSRMLPSFYARIGCYCLPVLLLEVVLLWYECCHIPRDRRKS